MLNLVLLRHFVISLDVDDLIDTAFDAFFLDVDVSKNILLLCESSCSYLIRIM